MILLDTNAAFWVHTRHRRARPLLKLPRLHLSPASVLEFQVLLEKRRIEFGSHSTSAHLVHALDWQLDEPPTGAWFLKALEIGWTRDTYDRLLVAHARVRGWKLATGDQLLLEHLPLSEAFPL
jgi:PIN domain nuclease of toxin-antitoxin system